MNGVSELVGLGVGTGTHTAPLAAPPLDESSTGLGGSSTAAALRQAGTEERVREGISTGQRSLASPSGPSLSLALCLCVCLLSFCLFAFLFNQSIGCLKTQSGGLLGGHAGQPGSQAASAHLRARLRVLKEEEEAKEAPKAVCQ